MKASSLFMRTAVITVFVGMGIGVVMTVTEDFALAPVHAHVNLLGWASMFLFGLYYRVTPEADRPLALIQYGLALMGLILFAGTLALFFLGYARFDAMFIIGILCTMASMLIFAWTVFATTRRCPAAASIAASPSDPNAAS